MGQYLIRRSFFMVLVLFIVSVLTFLIFVKLPAGDPARMMAGQRTNAEDLQEIRENLGLDQPFWVQYGRFAKGMIPWPGLWLNEQIYYSYTNNVAIKEEIYPRFPYTFALAIGAAVLWLVVGIPVGVISAIKRRIVRRSSEHDHGFVRGIRSRLLARLSVPLPVLVQVRHRTTQRDPFG